MKNYSQNDNEKHHKRITNPFRFMFEFDMIAFYKFSLHFHDFLCVWIIKNWETLCVYSCAYLTFFLCGVRIDSRDINYGASSNSFVTAELISRASLHANLTWYNSGNTNSRLLVYRKANRSEIKWLKITANWWHWSKINWGIFLFIIYCEIHIRRYIIDITEYNHEQ